METRYDGPSLLSTIAVGSLAIRLWHPEEPDRLLDDPLVARLNRDRDYMPYWAYLWPGAYLLAHAVSRRSWRGERALELGCGLGLAGLVGLLKGLRVCFSDYDEAPFSFVRRSAEANGIAPSAFSTSLLDWSDLPCERYRVILGADVLYERRLVPLVARVLARMLQPGGEALIADPYRVAAESFPEELAGLGLICEVEPVEAVTDRFGLVRGTLHRVGWPAGA